MNWDCLETLFRSFSFFSFSHTWISITQFARYPSGQVAWEWRLWSAPGVIYIVVGSDKEGNKGQERQKKQNCFMWKFCREFSHFYFFYLWRCFNFQRNVSEWVAENIYFFYFTSCIVSKLKNKPFVFYFSSSRVDQKALWQLRWAIHAIRVQILWVSDLEKS